MRGIVVVVACSVVGYLGILVAVNAWRLRRHERRLDGFGYVEDDRRRG